MFVSCCLVVTLTGHYIGLLSVLLLFSLYSLAAHSRRRNGVVGLVLCLLVFIGLAVLDVPDLGTSDLLQSCALLVAAWALGDAIRSRRTQQSERLRIASRRRPPLENWRLAPSSRNGCGSPASCTTSSRTACR